MAIFANAVTISAGSNYSWRVNKLGRSRNFTIDIQGNGSATIEVRHMDQLTFTTVATGVTKDTDPVTIYGLGFKEIRVTEEGVDVIHASLATGT